MDIVITVLVAAMICYAPLLVDDLARRLRWRRVERDLWVTGGGSAPDVDAENDLVQRPAMIVFESLG